MDPGLIEAARRGSPTDVVEAVTRVAPGRLPPPWVRVVAVFGDVATIRVRRGDLVRTHGDEAILSLKAPRKVSAEWGEGASERRVITTPSMPSGILPPGGPHREVVLGVLDWGCDVAHPAFRAPTGRTRLIGLWDQRGGRTPSSPKPYGYGRHLGGAQIDAALRSGDPYGQLRYHPADADQTRRGSHGTHVMGIAAGRAVGDVPAGVAPTVPLVFVHLATSGGARLATLGDSTRILEAVDYVRRIAGPRPWVINMSVGRHGGPHDGSTLVERAFDAVLAERRDRAIVQSAGNYFQRRAHATGSVTVGEVTRVPFDIRRGDPTPDELEVWYPGSDEFVVRFGLPDGRLTPWVELGEREPVRVARSEIGRLYHRRSDPNNGDHHVNLFLTADAPPGRWELQLLGRRVSDGRFHAWFERDDGCRRCQARFPATVADPTSTTGTVANGRLPLVVGAVDGQRHYAPARFSSSGPTRDGRIKPDLVAPGVNLLAARSTPRGARTWPSATVKSGSSMAAPQIAGLVALLLQRAQRPLSMEQIREIVLGGSTFEHLAGATAERSGAGMVVPSQVLGAVGGWAVEACVSGRPTCVSVGGSGFRS